MASFTNIGYISYKIVFQRGMKMDKRSELALFYLAYQEFSQKINIIQYDINKNQHRILFLTDYLDVPTIKSVLAIMRISKQAFNKLYRNLHERKLIDTRALEEDKRVKVLILTDLGKQVITKINQEQASNLEVLLHKNNNNWQKVLSEMANNYLRDI